MGIDWQPAGVGGTYGLVAADTNGESHCFQLLQVCTCSQVRAGKQVGGSNRFFLVGKDDAAHCCAVSGEVLQGSTVCSAVSGRATPVRAAVGKGYVPSMYSYRTVQAAADGMGRITPTKVVLSITSGSRLWAWVGSVLILAASMELYSLL